MATRMQQRRGTASEWASVNPILTDGEIGFERDTGIHKIGDGATPWASLLQPFVTKRGGDTITASGVGVIPLALRVATGQTANAFELRDSSGTAKTSVGPSAGGIATTGASTLTADAAGVIPLVAKGATGQTANLFEARDSAAAVKARIDANGGLLAQGVKSGSDLGLAWLEVSIQSASQRGLLVRGSAGQTAPAIEIQDSAGTTLSRIGGDGRLFAPAVRAGTDLGYAASTPLTVGATTTNVPTFIVRAVSGQTANFAEFQNTTGTALLRIDSSGSVNSSGALVAADVVYAGGSPSWFGGQMQSIPSAANRYALVLRAASGQTADIQQWQNANGTPGVTVTNDALTLNTGYASVGWNLASQGLDTSSQLRVSTAAAGNRGITVRGAAAQTGDLLRLEDNGGNSKFRVSASTVETVFDVYSLSAFFSGTGVYYSATTNLGQRNTSERPLVVRCLAGNGQDLQQWQWSDGSAKAWVDASGSFHTNAQFRPHGPSAQDAIEFHNTTDGTKFRIRTRGGGGMEFVNNAYSAVVSYVTDAGAWSGQSFTSTSTRESKRDVESLQVLGTGKDKKGLAHRMKSLSAVSYMPVNGGRRLHSFVAEDAAKQMPEIVTFDDKGKPAGINLTSLGTITFAMVQHLMERIDGLESRLASVGS